MSTLPAGSLVSSRGDVVFMWCFRRKAPGEKIRNPIQGEFFATEAIDGPAQALVRESVQNSLDAREGTRPVSVRIMLASGDDALTAAAVSELFGPAWPHYGAIGNGLHAAPTAGSLCPYLVIEDFGTKGLTGDPGQTDPDPNPAVRNPFFLFFRAEGLSAKTGTELGRWGIGKFVFPRSSLASTHFGLTVRHDDRRRLLLGAVTLKAHRIQGDDAMFSPDGLYGGAGEGDLVLPIEEPSDIDAFCRLFSIARTTEPGLSVVVPFVDPDITFEKLLLAAAKDYFLPILNGRLEVTLVSSGRAVQLSADTLERVILENSSVLGDAIRATVTLARSAVSAKHDDRIMLRMPDPARAARWSDDLVAADTLVALQNRLAADAPIAVRVPITVRPKGDGNLPSWFDIFLVRDRSSDGRPVFVREGIIISDVRGRRAREIRSLVIIDHKPLAAMLGDSENPAHTQWQKDGSNFKGCYTYGTAAIAFVSDSIGELVAILNRRSEQADPTLTVDYFSVEPPEDRAEDAEDAAARQPKQSAGQETPGDNIEVEPRPTRVRIARDDGGFSVLPGSLSPPTPYLIEVRCAYDLRTGNPLKKWDPADFNLGSREVPIICEGESKLLQVKGNWALLRVDGPAFHARFQGFDVNRDVYVRVELREAGSAGQEA
jgi:hypothetical protein